MVEGRDWGCINRAVSRWAEGGAGTTRVLLKRESMVEMIIGHAGEMHGYGTYLG